MKTASKIIAVMVLATVITAAAMGRPSQESKRVAGQPVFEMEFSGESGSTLYMNFPGYLGIVRMPIFSTFKADVYED